MPSWGSATSIHVNAYRISSLVPGALALILADRLPWSTVYLDHRAVHAAGHRDDARS